MITTRTEPCVLVPVETLQRIRGWVQHWEADKRGNLTPTDESLNETRELLRDALSAPRTFAPAGE
jgi:hypothetical protein